MRHDSITDCGLAGAFLGAATWASSLQIQLKVLIVS